MIASLTSPKEMRALLCSLDAVLNDIGSDEDREAALDLLARTVQAISDEGDHINVDDTVKLTRLVPNISQGVVVEISDISHSVCIRFCDPHGEYRTAWLPTDWVERV